jgi:hypothetical protein
MQLEDLIGKFLVNGSSSGSNANNGGNNNPAGNGSSNPNTGKH